MRSGKMIQLWLMSLSLVSHSAAGQIVVALRGLEPFKPNKLRGMMGVGINWVNEGDGLGLSKDAYNAPSTEKLIRSLRYNYLRIPGGYLARTFDWKASVGTQRGTNRNYLGKKEVVKAGLAEMKRFAAYFGMEVMYTLNIEDTPESITQLLKLWESLEPRDKTRIRYVELGNEEYDRNPTEEGARTYSRNVVPIIAAIRKADPTIAIGAVVSNPQTMRWDATVFQSLMGSIDYLIWHRYVPYSRYQDTDSYEKTVQSFKTVDQELSLLQSMMGDSPLPILITEYNLSFYDGKIHQSLPLAPRYYLTLGNFLLLAVKHNVQGLVKWTLSSPGWHVFADLNFNNGQVPSISIGGMVSRVLNSWIAEQDSLAVWSTGVPDLYHFSILIGKKGENQLSLLIQNHTAEKQVIEWREVEGRTVTGSVSLFQSDDGRELWSDSSGRNLVSGSRITVYPYSLTSIRFTTPTH